jgi:cytoplasmic iron level regulating protein YaaA (DUF328/UPF0246 family)
MGKKKKSSGNSSQSKGERDSVSRSVVKAMRREYKNSFIDVMSNKIEAWKRGKRVMLSVTQVNQDGKKKTVRVNAKDVWGTYSGYLMHSKVEKTDA